MNLFKCHYCSRKLAPDETGLYIKDRAFHLICYADYKKGIVYSRLRDRAVKWIYDEH